ncbi:MAG: FadR family transcriptional regulator [Dehalococcoidia bacterium]|nr:FadR family transcriptional regulator [Dehalococcoidia bacterium]
MFTALPTRRLSETVADRIRLLIVSRKLKAGERLPSERELGRQFGISTATVREALRGLEAFGIIEKKRGKGGGIFVGQVRMDSVKAMLHSYFSSRDFTASQVNEVRAIIEPGTARLAALRLDRDAMDRLQENILFCQERLEKSDRAPSERDYSELEQAITDFHRLVAHASRNPVLILVTDYLMDFLLESTRKLRLRLDPEITARVIEEHRRIYELLKVGDGAGAQRMMRKHLAMTKKYLAEKEHTSGLI